MEISASKMLVFFCGIKKILVTSPSKCCMVSRFIHYTLDNFTNTGFVGTLQNLMCVSILSNVSTSSFPSRVDPVQRDPLGLVGQLVQGLDDRPEGGVLVLHHDLQVKILLVLLADACILF